MISIIIPCYNQHDMTRECLDSIAQHTKDYEVVLVDNGSSPEIEPAIGERIIRNKENLGFSAAVNQGIQAGKGDTIILLNNDVIVTPGWADHMIEALKDCAIVGPVTNFCAGVQRTNIDRYETRGELDRAAETHFGKRGLDVRPVNFVIGFCMAFPRSVYDAVGPFDESLWPCSGEEVDFCFRAREMGLKVGVVQGCYIHHHGSVTFKTMHGNQLDYAKVCEASDRHLAERWGNDFWLRQAIQAPAPKGLCLNLGCGYRKLDGFVNIDIRKECQPDLVCNVVRGLPYEDNSIDMVRADDFLEHIPLGLVIDVMNDIWRVLKPGGVFESLTPSTDGRGAWQDPTHLSFWNQNSWLYFSDPEYRALYGTQADFTIESIVDVETNPARRIIHTHVIARARK